MRLGTMAQLQGAAHQRDMIVNELHKKNAPKGVRGLRNKLMRASLSKTYGDPEFIDDTVQHPLFFLLSLSISPWYSPCMLGTPHTCLVLPCMLGTPFRFDPRFFTRVL